MNYKERELRDNIEKLSEGGMFHGSYTVTDGVMTWNSNGRVPFDDMLAAAIEIGENIDLAACKAARDADTAAFLAEYVEAQKNRTPEQIAEEAFEMRAAFGPGETIVNIFTGKVTRT